MYPLPTNTGLLDPRYLAITIDTRIPGYASILICIALAVGWFFFIRYKFLHEIEKGEMPSKHMSRFNWRWYIGAVLLLGLGITLFILRDTVFGQWFGWNQTQEQVDQSTSGS